MAKGKFWISISLGLGFFPCENSKLNIDLDELSWRGFHLSEHVIDILASCFTAYTYRRRCIQHGPVKINPQDEIAFMDKNVLCNPKNFQILEHKKTFVAQTRNYKREIAMTKTVLEDDAKNYHAWAYLSWLCTEFDLFEELRPMVDSLIKTDVGNNSAWSFRHFLYNSRPASSPDSHKANILGQAQFAVAKIQLWTTNEAAWNYLKGFFLDFNIASLRYKS